VLKTPKIETPHIVGQLYGVPHGIFKVFNTILYENEFQNPQTFQQGTIKFIDFKMIHLVI
jgi:hypothetical protein